MKKSNGKRKYLPNYYRVWLDMGVGFLLLLLPVFFIHTEFYAHLTLVSHWAFLVFSPFFVGLVVHYQNLFLHAAGHYELHSSRKVNDILGNWLYAYWFLQSVDLYRKKHFMHHKVLGYREDPEGTYFDTLNLTNILNVLIPVKSLVKLKQIYRDEKDGPLLDTLHRHVSWRTFVFNSVVFFCIHGFVFVIFFGVEYWLEYLLLWVIPFVSIGPAFAYIRTICEHRPFTGEGKVVSRNFHAGIVEFFMGAAGFRYHFYHHLNMGVHYTALPEFKMDTENSDVLHTQERENFVSFMSVFRELYKHR